MAHLPNANPDLGLFLADQTLTPIISSSSSFSSRTKDTDSQSKALRALARTSLTAYDAALRLEMGRPQRLMVEHGAEGPVLIQSFLGHRDADPNPETGRPPNLVAPQREPESLPVSPGSELVSPKTSRNPSAPTTPGIASSSTRQFIDTLDVDSDSDSAALQPPPLLSIVVAPSPNYLKDAQRATTRLERIGREFQKEWIADQPPDEGIGHKK